MRLVKFAGLFCEMFYRNNYAFLDRVFFFDNFSDQGLGFRMRISTRIFLRFSSLVDAFG